MSRSLLKQVPPHWLWLIALTLLPTLVLLAGGVVWLWNSGHIWAWLALSLWCTVMVIALARSQSARHVAPPPLAVEVDPQWSKQGRAAWQQVERLAAEVAEQPPEIEDWRPLWSLLKQVMQRVADEYHPDREDAILALKVPDLLHVIELLAHDLRHDFVARVPGSGWLTVADLRMGQRLAKRGQQLYDIYRLVSTGVDPVAAAMREMRGAALQGLIDASLLDIRRWLLDAYIKKIGFYAIALYSGQLQAVGTRGLEHRIVLAGLEGSGYDQLLEALGAKASGQHQGAPAFLRQIEGAPAQYFHVVRLDQIEATSSLLAESQLILLCCSALQPARSEERRWLQQLRQAQSELPPLLVVLSGIDRLRPPRQWQPPYDLSDTTSPKAVSIRTARDALAAALDCPPSRVLPVCLDAAHRYNLEAVEAALLRLLTAPVPTQRRRSSQDGSLPASVVEHATRLLARVRQRVHRHR